jgi:hypothetical protein
MPSECKKRAQGLEGPLDEIVATEEQKWVNLQFLWRMIASLPEGSRRAQAKTQRRKQGGKEGSRKDAKTQRRKQGGKEEAKNGSRKDAKTQRRKEGGQIGNREGVLSWKDSLVEIRGGALNLVIQVH